MVVIVRQVKSAELAREYQRNLGYTSPGQLIKLIGQGKLDKSDITAQDVVRALDIFGPDLGDVCKLDTLSSQCYESLRICDDM